MINPEDIRLVYKNNSFDWELRTPTTAYALQVKNRIGEWWTIGSVNFDDLSHKEKVEIRESGQRGFK